jgi:putative membrane protein
MFGTGWCGGMGAAGLLFMVLIWGGFIAVVVWAVLRLFPSGRLGSGGQEPPGQDTAADLDRRLAAGEIDADTYLRQRETLTGAR